MTVTRRRIRVQGIVQGVGFRPFVCSTAQQYGCTGWVRNSAGGVEAELQGPTVSVDSVLATIRTTPPPMACVVSISVDDIPCHPTDKHFEILTSDLTARPTAYVAPDIATCAECLDELRNPDDRRYYYPFINCTHCGPRFTIQKSVPYDRPETTMAAFTMCDLCRIEYESPNHRRFHAQANACPDCGPNVWYVKSTRPQRLTIPSPDQRQDRSATYVQSILQSVRADISAGLIVGIKGIGGFHLACDARQIRSISRLRELKRRPFKPLAVMASDVETARTIVELSPNEKELLESRQRPIVLVKKRRDALLPELLAPNNPYLGVLLPYTPLHSLLLERGDVWVMTSGNLADEPIAFENEDALDRLSEVADSFLLHDRSIFTVCDDSVLRASPVGPIPIRRSRGYAPLPITLRSIGPDVLAVGAELKNTICLTNDNHAFLGQHVGDMGNRDTMLAVERSCLHLQQLYQSNIAVIASDQHPGYLSCDYARRLAENSQRPLIRVQHHHAHAAALMAEHNLPEDQTIIACVLDGTGFGTDSAIWGGEILLANASSFRRAAHLQYAPLPGGDLCILHPCRTALAYLYSMDQPWSEQLPSVQAIPAKELALLRKQLAHRINVVPTSSLGRLFDVVASLTGLCHKIDYEGQAAMELEFMADTLSSFDRSSACYKYEWTSDSPSQLQWKTMLIQICEEVEAQVPLETIAYKFHFTLAQAFAEKCHALRLASDQAATLNCVGLTGGVFQNALFLALMVDALVKLDFRVLFHRVVPPNDGGLALGQAVVARSQTLPQQT